MTTQLKKQTQSLNLRKAKKFAKEFLALEDKLYLFLSVISLFADYNDVPLNFLSVVFFILCTNNLSKAVSASAMTVFYIFSLMTTSYYVPNIAFLVVYIIAGRILENEDFYLKPVHFAALVYALSKGYLLSYGFDRIYWIGMLCECLAFIFLPDCVNSGILLLKNNQEAGDAVTMFELFCALCAVAFALEGIHIYGVIPSTAFLLCTSLYYKDKNNMTISLCSAIVMFLSLSQSDNFNMLFSGFFAIYLAAFSLKGKSLVRYGVLCLFSLAVSMAFIVKFNSMVFLTTTAISMLGYFAVDKLNIIKVKTISRCSTTGEKNYIQIMEKLDKLNRCFRFLGYTVIDISNILTKDSIPQELEVMVTNQVCKGCKNNSYCWQEKYNDTQSQFAKYAKQLREGSAGYFDDYFVQNCPKVKKLEESFENLNRLLSTQKLINAAGRQNQKILQNQFLAMAQTIQEISSQTATCKCVNTDFTHMINRYVNSMGKSVNYCICYEQYNKCVLSLNEYLEGEEIIKIQNKLEYIYSQRFSQPYVVSHDDTVVYTFCQKPQYSFECAGKSLSKEGVCGDIWEYFSTDEYVYLILADGMGTGSFAAAEGKTAVTMFKNLLCASVSVETAVEIVNIALNLKGTGQSCVAVDILQVNVYTGEGKIYKAGGEKSILFSKGNIKLIYNDTLPIGILKDIKLYKTSFLLNNGDTVLMFSDGVKIKEEILQRLKLSFISASSEDISSYIVSHCSVGDDTTAIAFKLIRA